MRPEEQPNWDGLMLTELFTIQGTQMLDEKSHSLALRN